MGLADKFNELKDMVTGAVEEAKGQAGEMLGNATEAPIADQAGEALGNVTDAPLADQAGEAVQGAEDAAQGAEETAQNAGDQAQQQVEDFRNDTGL